MSLEAVPEAIHEQFYDQQNQSDVSENGKQVRHVVRNYKRKFEKEEQKKPMNASGQTIEPTLIIDERGRPYLSFEVAVVEDHRKCIEVEADSWLEFASEDLQSIEHNVGGHKHDESYTHYQQGSSSPAHSPSVAASKNSTLEIIQNF